MLLGQLSSSLQTRLSTAVANLLLVTRYGRLEELLGRARILVVDRGFRLR